MPLADFTEVFFVITFASVNIVVWANGGSNYFYKRTKFIKSFIGSCYF